MGAVENDELYHYGVLGMKWGVHRAARKTSANERLRKKALNYDIKADRYNKKSEKIHAEQDMERSNKAAKKAANYSIRSEKLQKKALKETSDLRRSKLEKKSNKLAYKSATQQMEANRLSKSVGYGGEAMKYSVKSDRMAKKAAKARMKIANNDYYITRMNERVNSVSDNTVQSGRSYSENALKES